MDDKVINKQRALVALFLLFIYAVIIISISQEQGQNDLVLTLRQNPLFIFFLILPIIMWFVFLIKGNTKSELLIFLRDNFMRYLSKFMSFIITAYLAFFVLIPHKNEDFIDIIIEIVLALTAFVLFLFACWFEESTSPPMNRKNIKSFTKLIIKITSSLAIPLLILSLGYYFIFSLNLKSSFLIGFIQTTLLFASLSPAIISKGKKIWLLILFLLLYSGMIFWMSKFQEFALSTFQLYLALIIGIIIVIVGVIFSAIFKEKEWFKNFSKDLFLTSN